MNNIDLEKKDSVKPNLKEKEFAKNTLEKVFSMIKDATETENWIEAQALSWSVIEQVFLPRLIGWTAEVHKVKLPKEFDRLNAQSMNLLYLCLSHDQELYGMLEKARKSRNKIIHDMVNLIDSDEINQHAIKSGMYNLELSKSIDDRFHGKITIPVMNLYSKGWNDCREKFVKQIKSATDKYYESVNNVSSN